ncbi:iron-containing alcohol dehydrogenase [Streptomyces sp. NPDC088354]|uniref:iron-containing alcohol dehydrogenase n=1 Tax=Streptomyces sp. NPDC088354 TaxID=3365856 RepID=UPI0038083780
MRAFAHRGQVTKVVFGTGTRNGIADEVRALGCDRALVLSTPGQTGQAHEVRELLGPLAAGVFDQAAPHTPVAVTEKAVGAVRAAGADCVVAVGGGSAIGLGKAVALRTGHAHIALPTTYAGSEMTPVLGETQGGAKTTRRLPEVLLRTVVYDVDLTLALPPHVAAVSGLNAMAHAVEALYAQDHDPLALLIAGEALDALATNQTVRHQRPGAVHPPAAHLRARTRGAGLRRPAPLRASTRPDPWHVSSPGRVGPVAGPGRPPVPRRTPWRPDDVAGTKSLHSYGGHHA